MQSKKWSESQATFSGKHNAIMWISTKALLLEDEGVIIDIITKKLKDKIVFYGFCFGRFDLIVEFKETSAKVASNIVCELQDKIVKKLNKKRKEIEDPVCSSLSICNKVIHKNSNKNLHNKLPIRTYTFLRPKVKGLKLEKVVSHLEPKMELFWNSSSYSFILTSNGSNFHKIFSKILNFRSSTGKYFSESCTYVGLRMRGREEKCIQTIKAITFVKLSKGYGGLLTKKDLKLGWKREKMDKRLGWSDISLEIEKSTLMEIKMAILGLRKNHEEEKDIANTSTLLLPKEEKEK